jgi:hypothetical protein
MVMVFNATYNTISVSLMEETGIHRENLLDLLVARVTAYPEIDGTFNVKN